mgnify:CR=1 FL=1
MRVVIVDYGMGNLGSVRQALNAVGCQAHVTADPEGVLKAGAIVLPGVGAFGRCMKNLEELGLKEAILEKLETGTPYLGICLGYQILFEESEESPEVAGLGLLKGKVVRFSVRPESGYKVPHMGWNTISIKRPTPLLDGIEDGSYFYFVHSFYPVPEDEGVIATTTEYGINFASSISYENIFACQFHPEKSQKVGLRLLSNFVGLLGGTNSEMALRAISEAPPPSGNLGGG